MNRERAVDVLDMAAAWNGCGRATSAEVKEALSMAKAALREQIERSKGCWACLMPTMTSRLKHELRQYLGVNPICCHIAEKSCEGVCLMGLKPCPDCGGEIRILVNIARGAFAKCKACSKEFDICGIDKIPTYKGIHIRKSTADKIRRWWNRRVGEGEKE